ncbi:MAG TPA: ATP-binding protein [Planctomycetota bacterium]|nr:ATP-binding protein [Planctomycetota bacterium]
MTGASCGRLGVIYPARTPLELFRLLLKMPDPWAIIDYTMGDYSEDDFVKPLPRSLQPVLEDRLRRMPVVAITGARQTGKTTLVRSFGGGGEREYLTLDSLTTLDQARRDPESLVHTRGPLTLDEVQRAPELLLAIKKEVDRDRRRGRFLLTCSANLLLMKSVSDSLAGRASYLILRPLTCREKRRDTRAAPWTALLEARDLDAGLAVTGKPQPLSWDRMALEGGYPPAALARSPEDRVLWFDAYVSTYLERDLRDLTQVGDLGAFLRVARLASLRNGGLLNHAEIGRDAQVGRSTVQRWLSLLETSFLITLLEPFHESRSKRIIKAPKLYFGDTGLGLFLAGVQDADELRNLPGSGAWLENLILNDLLAWRETQTRKPGVYFRRTVNGEEVDFVLEGGRRLLPMEVKASAAVRVADAKGLDSFCAEFPGRAPFALLLHDGEKAFRLTRTTLAVPLGCVL